MAYLCPIKVKRNYSFTTRGPRDRQIKPGDMNLLFRADFSQGDHIEVRTEDHHNFAMMTVLGIGIGWSAYRDPRMKNATFEQAVAMEYYDNRTQVLTGIGATDPEPQATTEYPEHSAGWWFHKMPEPYRGKAIVNTQRMGLYLIFNSLDEAIDLAFDWGETAQGADYWHEIHKRALKGEFN